MQIARPSLASSVLAVGPSLVKRQPYSPLSQPKFGDLTGRDLPFMLFMVALIKHPALTLGALGTALVGGGYMLNSYLHSGQPPQQPNTVQTAPAETTKVPEK